MWYMQALPCAARCSRADHTAGTRLLLDRTGSEEDQPADSTGERAIHSFVAMLINQVAHSTDHKRGVPNIYICNNYYL